MVLSFRGYFTYNWGLVYLRLAVSDSHVGGLVFLRWGLVILTFRGSFSYVWGLVILKFRG